MKKLIDPFAKNGSRTAMSATRQENGWLPNDKPPAEEWNWFENYRDKESNDIVSMHVSNSGGINPDRLEGLDTRMVPVIRPNAFEGSDAAHNGGYVNPYNKGKPTNTPGPIYDISCGFDPSTGKPVIVASSYNSIVSSGDTEAELTFWPCWDYSLHVDNDTPSPKTVDFGTLQVQPLSHDMPVLVCDGYLYVVVAEIGTYGDRFIFQYDLTDWTGTPVASLELGSGQSFANCLCTELIEATDTQLAIAFKNLSFNQVRFLIIEKDLSSRTMSNPVLGYDVMHRWLRSDGYNLFVGANNATTSTDNLIVYPFGETTPTATETALSDSNWRIVDFIPSSLDVIENGNLKIGWAYIYDTSNTVPTRLRAFGDTGTPAFSPAYCEIEEGETGIGDDKHGSFCLFGSDLYTSFKKTYQGQNFALYKRYDFSTMSRSNFVLTHSFAHAEPIGNDLGHFFNAAYQEEQFTTKLIHDGRDLWWVKNLSGGFYRIRNPRK